MKKLKFPKPTKKRKLTKQKVWKLFSKYIRLRDCFYTTGVLTRGKCITCGKTFPFKQLQAGHLLDGRSGEAFMDERGVFAQCMQCNVWRHGFKERFIPWFLDAFGKPLYNELERLKRKPKKWNQSALEDKKKEIEENIAYIKGL